MKIMFNYYKQLFGVIVCFCLVTTGVCPLGAEGLGRACLAPPGIMFTPTPVKVRGFTETLTPSAGTYPGIIKNSKETIRIWAEIPRAGIERGKLKASAERNLLKDLTQKGKSQKEAEYIVRNFKCFLQEWTEEQYKMQGTLPDAKKNFVIVDGPYYSFHYLREKINLNIKLFDGQFEKQMKLTKPQLKWLRIWLRIHEELELLETTDLKNVFAKQKKIFLSLKYNVQSCLIEAFKKTEHPELILNSQYLSELHMNRDISVFDLQSVEEPLIRFDKNLSNSLLEKIKGQLKTFDFDIDYTKIAFLYGSAATNTFKNASISILSKAAIFHLLINLKPEMLEGLDLIIQAFKFVEKSYGFSDFAEDIIRCDNRGLLVIMLRKILYIYYYFYMIEELNNPELQACNTSIVDKHDTSIVNIDGVIEVNQSTPDDACQWIITVKTAQFLESKIKKIAYGIFSLHANKKVYPREALSAFVTQGKVKKTQEINILINEESMVSEKDLIKLEKALQLTFIETVSSIMKTKSLAIPKEVEYSIKNTAIHLIPVPESRIFSIPHRTEKKLAKQESESMNDTFKGSLYTMFEYLKDKGVFISPEDIAGETGLSQEYTIQYYLRTLYSLGLVKKRNIKGTVRYSAVSINPYEWENIVKPVIMRVKAHPSRIEMNNAKRRLTNRLKNYREKRKNFFRKIALNNNKKRNRIYIKNALTIPLGGIHNTGGSAFYVKAGYTRFLIDAGQGIQSNGPFTPRFDLVDDGVDFIIVSHPHIDHIGCLPEAIDLFGQVPIYTTELGHEKIKSQIKHPSSFASRLIEYKERGIELVENAPRINDEELKKLVHHRINRIFHSMYDLETDRWYHVDDDVKISLYTAGHLAEATMIAIATPFENILYTGDISLGELRTAKQLKLPDIPVDRLFLESTYGGRFHGTTRIEKELELIGLINRVYEQKGTILIPAFALGRSSEILLILAHYKKRHILPEALPIYIDGMSREIINHDLTYSHMMPLQTQHDIEYLLQDKSNVHWVSSDSMRKRIINEPCCIIASSGMLLEHSCAARHYAPHILKNSNNALILVGYQAEETPGHTLLKRKRGETIILDEEEIPINAHVAQINFSAHADHAGIIKFSKLVKAKLIVLMHGDEEAKKAIVHDLDVQCEKSSVIIPETGKDIYHLSMSDEEKALREKQFKNLQSTPIVHSKKTQGENAHHNVIKQTTGVYVKSL